MKTFQALILLFIYFLFTAGGISRAPLCDQGKNCQRSDKQISFDESTTPPAECHETEAQQSSIIEHRRIMPSNY